MDLKSLRLLAEYLLGERRELEEGVDAQEVIKEIVNVIATLYDTKPKELPFFVPKLRLDVPLEELKKAITPELVKKSLYSFNFLEALLSSLEKNFPSLKDLRVAMKPVLEKPLFLSDVVKPAVCKDGEK